DPVASGLVASLARPGGNTTGFTNFEFPMAGKWLELLKEVAPTVQNVTVLFNPDNAGMPGQLSATARAAPALGLQLSEARVRNRSEIERAIDGLGAAPNAGLLVLPEFLTTGHRNVVTGLAARHRLPADTLKGDKDVARGAFDFFAAEVAAVSDNIEIGSFQCCLRLLGHACKLRPVTSDVCHLMRDDQMMFGIDGDLNIVADNT